MRKTRRPVGHPRRAPRTASVFFERLENRTLLDGSNIFAQFSGVIPAAGSALRIPITLSTSSFTLPGRQAVLGFEVQAASGSHLDPAAVTITNSAGATVNPSYSIAEVHGSNVSLALASLTYGAYSIAVRGQGATSGEFQLSVFLAGDASGDHNIDLGDGSQIRSLIGSVAGDGRYLLAADSNLDGQISSFDYTQWRFNQGDSTNIAPLVLTLQTPTGLVQLPSGALATSNAAVVVSGTTNPGAAVALATGNDGKFDDGSTIAESSGHFPFNVSLGSGGNNLQVMASDSFGQQKTAALAILLDTHAPIITVTSPTSGLVTTTNPTVTGRVTDDLAGVASLQAAVDGGAFAPVSPDAGGNFSFTTSLPLDDSADGPHTVHLRATDLVGNIAAPTDVAFTLESCMGFADATIGQSGGSASGKGGVTIDGCDATLREGDSFDVTLREPITIPQQASTLTFSFSAPSFDRSSQGRVKDAYEVALVDGLGNSLVPAIAASRDSFLNISEGQPTARGTWATLSGQTVTLDLSNITPGTAATLVFRLANNDGDVNTSVDVGSVRVVPLSGSPADPGGQPPASIVAPASIIDFTHLADVSASVQPIYGRTSLDQTTNVLYADVAARNAGSYVVDAPLIVAVDHLSDPTVRVRGADGTTPDGLPYFDVSALVGGGKLAAGAITGTRTISFADPGGVSFTYDLEFLGHINQSPRITSKPNQEALVGKSYVYNVTAADPENDALTFSLLSGPPGMTVDSSTGVVNWVAGSGNVGNAAVSLRVDDGHGGSAAQNFTLSVINPPPNRPPVFTSFPIVDANVNITYRYQVKASDPDGDLLTYAVAAGPGGLAIDPQSGLVSWTSNYQQVGSQDVSLTAADGRGGVATQSFTILVQQERGNHAPVIVSDPVTSTTAGQPYSYAVDAIDSDGDSLKYSLTQAPPGMEIDPQSGLINWHEPAARSLSNAGVGDDGTPLLIGDVDPHWSIVAGPGISSPVPAIVTNQGYYATSPRSRWVWVNKSGNGGSNATYTFRQTLDLTGFDPKTTVIAGAWGTDNVGTILLNGATPVGTGELSLSGYTAENFNHFHKFNLTGGFVAGINTLDFVVTDYDNLGAWNVTDLVVSAERFASNTAVTVRAEDGRGGSDEQSFVIDVNPAAPGEIRGTVFEDRNGNKTRESNEPALPGWTVYLDQDNDGVRDANEQAVTSGDDGKYAFRGLSAGQYIVREEPQLGWLQTFPGDQSGTSTTAYYVDWTSADVSHGTASGVITLPGGSTVTVNAQAVYADNSPGSFYGAQTNGGTNYWIPSAPYISDQVTNAPPDPDILQLPGGQNQIYRITFSEPIVDPIMAIVSLGSTGAPTTYDFDSPFTIISQGPGYWGGTSTSLSQLPGDILLGAEGHGTIKFLGTYSTFAWTVPTPETWHGFTFAIRTSDSLASDGFHLVNLAAGEIATGKDFGNLIDSDPPVNFPPVFGSIAPTAATSGQRYRYDAIVTDPDRSDRPTFDLVVKPAGMSVDPTRGVVVWTPSSDQVGEHDVILRVQDGRGGVALQSFRVKVGLPNSAPVITSTPQTQALVGVAYAYQTRALDEDGNRLAYSLTSSPQGMTIDSSTGFVTWSPSVSQIGLNPVTINVSDGLQGSDSQSFTIVVSQQAPGAIQGTVFNDANGDGVGTEPVLFLTSYSTNSVLRFDATTGQFKGEFVLPGSGGLSFPETLDFGPDGNLYVLGNAANPSVLRYDGQTGAFLGPFTPPIIGGGDLLFGPDGKLYVAAYHTNEVLRFDGETGAFIDTFVSSGSGGLNLPANLAFGTDGNLYVDSYSSVNEYDGQTGAFLKSLGGGGMVRPTDMQFGPDGYLYVADYITSAIYRFDASAGAFKDIFVTSGSGGLSDNHVITFGPDGDLYLVDSTQSAVFRYDGATGAFIDRFITPGSGGLTNPYALAFSSMLETGLSAWTVYLDQNQNGSLDPGETSTSTDAAGNYRFRNLVPGSYTVAEVGQPGWRQTTPDNGASTVTVQPGASVDEIDFGNTVFGPPAGSHAPSFVSSPSTLATFGQPYSHDPVVINPDGRSLIFDLTRHPAGMVIDPQTGVLVWTPSADEIGVQAVSVRVTDAIGLTALQSFTVTVHGVNIPPDITSEPPTTGQRLDCLLIRRQRRGREQRSADL